MKELQMKMTERNSNLIREKYIPIRDYERNFKMFESKKKKEFKILLKAMQDLNKTIRKLKEQEIFLNELIDERDEKIRTLDI